MRTLVRGFAPGLALLAVVGGISHVVGVTTPLNGLVVAILLGIILTNVHGVPAVCRTGVETHKLWLEVGIVLMGARVALDAVLAVGPTLLGTVLVVVTITLVVGEVFSRTCFGLEGRLGSLLAAGAGICGVSAVVAVAGSIEADEDQIAYATSTVLLFDAITLFAYPMLGHLLGLPDQVFGIWAGLSMFSTGPVTAAGFAYSDTAGQWATLTKLTRNVLLGLVVLAYSVAYTDIVSVSSEQGGTARNLWQGFPKFVVGFVSLMLLASSGVLTNAEVGYLKQAYRGMFLIAFAGLGLTIDVADLQETGIRPAGLLLAILLVASFVSLVAIQVAF